MPTPSKHWKSPFVDFINSLVKIIAALLLSEIPKALSTSSQVCPQLF